MTTVSLRNYRQAPRKVRLVTDLIRGKKVEKAMTMLQFVGKRAGEPIAKLLKSGIAAALASDTSLTKDALHVESIRVDKGFTYKRMRPRAFGRGAAIHKETSHVLLTLSGAKSAK